VVLTVAFCARRRRFAIGMVRPFFPWLNQLILPGFGREFDDLQAEAKAAE